MPDVRFCLGEAAEGASSILSKERSLCVCLLSCKNCVQIADFV